VAVWFALNMSYRLDERQRKYAESPHPFGWIHFIHTEREGEHRLKVADLRAEYHPLSLRPHVQHGIAATRRTKSSWDNKGVDLSPYILASVRIPNNCQFRVLGKMFTQEFLFPSITQDHTYNVLLTKEVEDLVRSVGERSRYQYVELGQILKY